MNQKPDNTGNITTNKPVRYAVAPGVTMDEKTYYQYIADVKRVRSRAIKLTISVVAVWAIYALVINFDDVFFSPVFNLSLFLCGAFYFLNCIFIQVKYRIPIQFLSHNEGSMFSDYDDSPGSASWRIRHNML